MALDPGTRFGPYDITAQIGAGGMGEVYRARDTKLSRDVALKVLPEAFTLDPDRVARFKREAQVLASLNHPNIGAIYGFEESNSVQALVLELVEGPTLADRITQGPLPLDEAVSVAVQVAEALEAAHEQGIIHRDLKPANIKLRPDGTVKVLDFGLAKLTATEASGVAAAAGPSQSPTITSPALMTGVGVLLGTAAYMAPEQAKGRPADKRSDVWAFGCVLYEMLTAKRAFEGEDIGDTLASILKSDPDWTLLPPEVPHSLRTLLLRCLVKDRRHRVSDISAALFILSELDNINAQQSRAGAPATRAALPRSRALSAAAMGALAATLVGGGSAWVLWPDSSPPGVSRFSITLPEGQAFSGTSRQVVTISPDGTRLAYVANARIYLRSIGELEPRAIPGTESTAQAIVDPMFAPDGESIAFIELASSATLKRVSIGGGTALTIASLGVGDPSGATWGPAGILIARRRESGIFRVSPTGGVLERIVGVGKDELAHGPQMLPDGRTVLFTLAKNTGDDRWDKAQIVAQSLANGSRRVLVDGGSDARYLPSGHLLYAVAATMFAVPFDASSLTITGAAVPVIVGVSRSTRPEQGATQLAVSETGTLAYLPGFATTTPMFRVVLGDGLSDPMPLKVPPAAYDHPRVSPDGRMVAVGRNEGQNSDIWSYDLSGSSEIRRLTFGGDNRFPVWSADGRRVTFQSGRDGDRAIFWQSADGTGPADRLTKPADGEEHVPESWSRDGRRLLFSVAKGSTFFLWVLTLEGKKTEPFGRAQSGEPLSASFSPDGRWIAYSSADGSGPNAPNRGVFVEPFPATGEKHQVPKAVVDFHPVWSPDGKSIFYAPTAGRPIVTVPITTSPAIAFGTPVESARAPRPDRRSGESRGYDVLPDGRFISVSQVYGEGPTAALSGEVRVVLNWFEELKRLVPTK